MKKGGYSKLMAEMLIIIWLVLVLSATSGLLIGYHFGKTFGTKVQLEKYAELDQALDNIWRD